MGPDKLWVRIWTVIWGMSHPKCDYLSLLVVCVTKLLNYYSIKDLKQSSELFNPTRFTFCSDVSGTIGSERSSALKLTTARFRSCFSETLQWHKSARATVSSTLHTFLVQKTCSFILEEENECDPGGADSGGRAPNTTLLVRPHTAHSVSSGRSGRSSLEIIKALISCQTPQRHPSITWTLYPPS